MLKHTQGDGLLACPENDGNPSLHMLLGGIDFIWRHGDDSKHEKVVEEFFKGPKKDP